jgi:hypothetical protein
MNWFLIRAFAAKGFFDCPKNFMVDHIFADIFFGVNCQKCLHVDDFVTAMLREFAESHGHCGLKLGNHIERKISNAFHH